MLLFLRPVGPPPRSLPGVAWELSPLPLIYIEARGNGFWSFTFLTIPPMNVRWNECETEKFGTPDSSDRTIAILGDRWWPQAPKQEGG